jgi:HEAT repeat protein
MKVWAAFAGDTLGPDYVDAIESYIWRITEQLPNIRTAVEDFALQMIASQKIALDLKQARGLEVEFQFNESDSKKDLESTERKKRKGSIRSLPGALPNLLESRLMVEHMGGRLSFSHPLVTAYLASAALANAPISHFLSNQEDWSGKTSTLSFLITSRDLSPEVSELLEINDDPLLRNPLKVGRWLSYTSKTTTWRTETLRDLAEQVQRENIPLGLRARLLSALLLSNDPAVNVLLGQISHTSIKDLRRMVALGLGYLLDSGSLSRLSELLEDPDPSIYQSACLALVRIGNKQAFELLGTAILHGNEDLQRTVAEALALNPADGHEMLKEASQMEDLMVRRSSVYGLVQIQKPWAREILEGLAVDDQEWVVRAAATQALEEAQVTDLRIPEHLFPLHETTWLISYAGEKGMGIAPGKPAQNLLISVLADGSPEQQIAALGYLKLKPDLDALPLIQKLLDEGSDDLIQAAYDTLWYYAAEGLDIQSPSSLPVS